MLKYFPYPHWFNRTICGVITGRVLGDVYGMKSRVLILIQSVYWNVGMQWQETLNLVHQGAILKSDQEVKKSCEMNRSGQQHHPEKSSFHFISSFPRFCFSLCKISQIWYIYLKKKETRAAALKSRHEQRFILIGTRSIPHFIFHPEDSYSSAKEPRKEQAHSNACLSWASLCLYVDWASFTASIYFLLFLWAMQDIVRNFIKVTWMAVTFFVSLKKLDSSQPKIF